MAQNVGEYHEMTQITSEEATRDMYVIRKDAIAFSEVAMLKTRYQCGDDDLNRLTLGLHVTFRTS